MRSDSTARRHGDASGHPPPGPSSSGGRDGTVASVALVALVALRSSSHRKVPIIGHSNHSGA